MLSYATSKLGTDMPCHDTSKSVNQMSNTPAPSLDAISWGFNRMDVYGIGADGKLAHQYWDGYQWGPAHNQIETLGGVLNSPPTAVSRGPGTMDIFLVGDGGSIVHKSYDGTLWQPSATTFESLGGALDTTEMLAVTANGANPIDILGRGTDGKIYHTWYDGSSWQPKGDAVKSLVDDATFIYAPAAVSWGPNRTDVFVIGTDFTLFHQYSDGTTWHTQWDSLGDAQFVDTPTAISWGANRLDIFGIEVGSGALIHTAWDRSYWSKWDNLGTPSADVHLVGTVAATSWSTNRLDIVALGSDGAYYYKYWDGSMWQPSVNGFISKGGSFASTPTVVSWGENRLDIYGVGNDNMVKHEAWHGSGWYPNDGTWETLGGPLESFHHGSR